LVILRLCGFFPELGGLFPSLFSAQQQQRHKVFQVDFHHIKARIASLRRLRKRLIHRHDRPWFRKDAGVVKHFHFERGAVLGEYVAQRRHRLLRLESLPRRLRLLGLEIGQLAQQFVGVPVEQLPPPPSLVPSFHLESGPLFQHVFIGAAEPPELSQALMFEFDVVHALAR